MEIRDDLRRDYERRINRAIDYLENHFAEDVNLERLAQEAAFSPFHFHRLFRALVGEPVGAFVRRVRLERSATMLAHDPHRPITDVALDCGFSSSAVFARAFRDRFGMSASEWRAAERKNRKTDRNASQADGKKGHTLSNDGKDHRPVPRYAPPWWMHRATTEPQEEAMQVKIESMSAIRAAYVRRLGSYEQSAGKAWEALCRWAGPRGLLGPGTMFFGISYDDPSITAPEKLRYDACIAVGPEVQSEGEVGIQELSECRVARAHYEGPGSGISDAYTAFYKEWLPESGFVPANKPCLEIYLDGLGTDGRFNMDICIPIEPA